jgi:hypothetical protein
MTSAARGNVEVVSRRTATDEQRSTPTDPAIAAAARLAAQRRRRSEADLARAVRLTLGDGRAGTGRFTRDRTPAEPMS